MMKGKLPFHLELLIEGTLLKQPHFKQMHSKAPRSKSGFQFVFYFLGQCVSGRACRACRSYYHWWN